MEKEKEKVKEKARGKEKDREKDKDKDRDEERESGEQPLLPRPPQVQSQPKERDKDAEDRIHPRSLHKFHLHRDHSQHKHSKEDLGLLDALASPLMPDHNHNFAYGWSAMLEEWHCHGGPPPPVHPNPSTSQLQGLNNNSKPPLLDVPISDEECMIPPKAKSTGDLALRMTPTVAEKGPYELLVKERMMGIYLAVFINRDIKGLVRGLHKHCLHGHDVDSEITFKRYLEGCCHGRVDRRTRWE